MKSGDVMMRVNCAVSNLRECFIDGVRGSSFLMGQVIRTEVLDDTGSSYLSLYEDDANLLGINPHTSSLLAGPVASNTFNRLVWRGSVDINVRLVGFDIVSPAVAVLDRGLSTNPES